MSLTGLFLSTFLIVHMAGNLQLFKGDGGRAFNEYTYFMTHNPVIMTVSYLLYTSILVHALMAFVLTRHNQASRPVKYAYSKPEANSDWSSRNMGILGTILLLFIIIHMRTFWYEMHFGSVPMAEYDGKQYKNLYAVVQVAFGEWWYVLLYVVCMGALGYHLAHGFQSGFQSRFNGDWRNPDYRTSQKGLFAGFGFSHFRCFIKPLHASGVICGQKNSQATVLLAHGGFFQRNYSPLRRREPAPEPHESR